MKYILLLGGSMLTAYGQQAPAPLDLTQLNKEQLIAIIQALSAQQQPQPPKCTPASSPLVAGIATLPPVCPTAATECAHFALDLMGQVAMAALTQNPCVTVQGVTNIAHQLISRMTNQSQKRSIAIDEQAEDDVTRYELLKRILHELEEIMQELKSLDSTLQ